MAVLLLAGIEFTTALADRQSTPVFVGSEPSLGDVFDLSTSSITPIPTYGVTAPRTGGIAHNAVDDLYNRVHIAPVSFTFGDIVSDQTGLVEVWNAHLTPKTLSSVTNPGIDGLSVNTPSPVPFAIRALEAIDVEIDVSASGAVKFDDVITLTVDGVDYDIAVSGQRIVLFNIKPDWKSPLSERFEWRTVVNQTFDKKEFRSQIRSKPRVQFSYRFVTTSQDDSNRLENLLTGWQNRQYSLPLWHDYTTLTSDAPAGVTSLSVTSTESRSFLNGSFAVLMQGDDFEVVEVLSVSTNSIDLKAQLSSSWYTGARVVPLMSCYITQDVSFDYVTSKYITGTLTFDARPKSYIEHYPNTPAPETYLGDEIVLKKPNWMKPLSSTRSGVFDTIDFLNGDYYRAERGATQGVSFRVSWMFKGKAGVSEARALLGRMKGRLTQFWVPTWTHDFEVVSDFSSGANTILVKNQSRDRFIPGNDPMKSHLIIRLRNGNWYARQVTGISQDSGDERVFLDSSIPESFTVADIAMVSWLLPVRFSSDAHTLSFITDSVVTLETEFSGVRT